MPVHRSTPTCVCIAALATLALSSAVAAQDAAEPTPVAVYRSAVMDALQAHTGALRGLTGGELSHPEYITPHAEAVAALARMLDGIFPEGSGGEGTRAMASIWDDPAGFTAAREAFQRAASALLDAARSGDTEAVAAANREVGLTCRECHGDFRARAGGG